MLIGNSAPGKPQARVNDKHIARLINYGRYREAFTLLNAIPHDKISVLFNLALCLVYAGDHAAAITKLDAASTLAATQYSPAGPPAAENVHTAAIKTRQAAEDTHMLPFGDDYAALFPDMVIDNILRLKVDCYAATGRWDAVIRTAAQLAGKNYANVERALSKAR